MSQPFDRAAAVPAPREPDERLDDFWVENVFDFPEAGENLSSFERNRVYLNEDVVFYDVSRLTNADSDGDGRSVVAADFTGDGMQDLLVRQAGGGPLLLYENRFEKANWLRVELRSEKSNSLGIGALVVAKFDGKSVRRENFSYNCFLGQGPTHVHLGLGDAGQVDELVVRWPSGHEQTLRDVPANQAIVVTEGSGDYAVRNLQGS